MSAISRWEDLDRSSRRTVGWLIAILAVVLVALSVPIGLRTLSGGGTTTAGSAAKAGVDEPSSGGATAASDGSGASGRDAAAAPSDAPGGAADAAKGSPGLSVVTAKIARSAWLGVQVTDLTAATAKARLVATTLGGQVSSENVVTSAGPNTPSDPTDPKGSRRADPGDDVPVPAVGVDEARLTLSVPSEKLEGALTELARLGTVSYRSSQAKDLTDSYLDTSARIEPMRSSVARVQALLAEATDLKQIVLIESELSKRQADLDSLTSRMAQLEKQTTMSDVTVTLWTGREAVDPPQDGFAAGLRKAWDGLLRSVTVIIAGLATLLPWLLVLGLLAWAGLRVMRRRSTPAAAPPPATASTSSTVVTPPGAGSGGRTP